MQIPAISSAAWGMAAASKRYDDAAQTVAASPEPDELVDATIVAPAALTANATVFRVADATRKSLLDVLA